jgi:cytochrome c biogenesis protein CcmG/thiol:disulfide interchange protein DsbE
LTTNEHTSDITPEDIAIRDKRLKHNIASGLLVGFVLSTILILGVSLTLNPNQASDALTGKPAAPFSVTWISGSELMETENLSSLKLEDFRGRPLIVNFWASWCQSCQQEAHLLEQFWKNYGQDIAVVGIAIHDTIPNAKAFAENFGKTYFLGLDEDGKAGIDYGVTGVPETFFIGSDGVIKHKVSGPVNNQLLSKMMGRLLEPTE